MELKTLNDDPNNPVLLSSIPTEHNVTLIIGNESVYNDLEEVLTIDSDFIKENIVFTIEKLIASKAKVSDRFITAIQECYDEKGHTNYLLITDELIKSCIYKGKIINQEIAKLFGLFLGTYIATKCGYKKVYIDNIDAFLHPCRQYRIMPKLIEFSDKLKKNA